MTNFAKDQLKSLVERIERVEEEKSALAGDIREIYAEAKGHGFDTKIMREVVRLRKMESGERDERDTLIDLYLSALGGGSTVTPTRTDNVVSMASAAE